MKENTLVFNGKAVEVGFVEPNSTVAEKMYLYIDNLQDNYRACVKGEERGKYVHLCVKASMTGDFTDEFMVNLFLGSVCKTAYREIEGGKLEPYRPYEDFEDDEKDFANLLRVSPQAFFAKYHNKVVQATNPILVAKFTVKDGNVTLLNAKREVFRFQVTEKTYPKKEDE